MNAVLARPLQWPWRRWWFLVALVFGLQVGAIYLLSDNSPIHPRPAGSSPMLHLSGNRSGELLALTDPTLFALPHREAFSGAAWLKMPAIPTASFSWTEPPQWLSAPTQELGTAFQRALGTYTFDQLQSTPRPEPDINLPNLSATATPPIHSTFRLVSGLTKRRLLAGFQLPDWPNNDLLTNTIIRLLVNDEGLPISSAVIASSGVKAADDFAREQARSARFESVAISGPQRNANALTGLTIGEIVFEWQTIPVPPTNSVAPPVNP